ncbi:hypothetical protein GGR31_002587 [Mesonia maritima]|uniref:Uncharacterized protein n=1 Tax=Mesonia maritima TaxID=1793873 RepID=A0ABU1K8G9_9FLAO|nr:hypothetical protein [Mesonia maritima]
MTGEAQLFQKGKSNEFNKEKFPKGKHKGNFCDDLKDKN